MDNTNYKICDICGNLVDNNNIVNINDNEVCKSCIEKKLEQKQTFSPLATFMCSLIPGVAHIYLGKKQKGLFILYSFFIINFFIISSILVIGILGLVNVFPFDLLFHLLVIAFLPINAIIELYSIFNANFSKKYIENNIYIEDKIDKLSYKFFNKKNKKYLEDKIIDKRLQ